MYEKHFNFSDDPFTIAPNPRYLYLTDQHREALAHLNYGLQENSGFILLTGEVGTGKTTVCRCLLENVPRDVHLALVLTPTLGDHELLESICDEFGVSYDKDATSKALTDALNRYLLEIHSQGQRAVVVIDEAQNLKTEVLEQLRLLTNLETNEQKLLQIILIAQPEFLIQLEKPQLRQLSQRIVARFHLVPLNSDGVRAYINHRLKIAGGDNEVFPDAVILRIAQLSQGVPRLINLLCSRALLGCYAQDKHKVDMVTLEQAAREVLGSRKELRKQMPSSKLTAWRLPAAATAAVIAVTLTVAWIMPRLETPRSLAWLPFQPDETPSQIAGSFDQAASETFAAAALPQPLTENEAESNDAPLTWISLTAEEYSEAESYLALFKRWRIDYPIGTQTPCGFASRNQLDCWHKNGTFGDLVHLNRPALLKMLSDGGEIFYVALLALKGDRVKLGQGVRTMETSRTRLEQYWSGEFTLLWRRPADFSRTLRPGNKSDFVAWVRDKISYLEGQKVAAAGLAVYDFSLIDRVRSLQRRCGLRVDGLVGRETVILINSLTSGVPMLSDNISRRCKRRLNV